MLRSWDAIFSVTITAPILAGQVAAQFAAQFAQLRLDSTDHRRVPIVRTSWNSLVELPLLNLSPSFSLLGNAAVQRGLTFVGSTTALRAIELSIPAAMAATFPAQLCCAFVSGVLRQVGLSTDPQYHWFTNALDAHLRLNGWQDTPLHAAPIGSVAFFDIPFFPNHIHGGFTVGYDGANAYFLESDNEDWVSPQQVRITRYSNFEEALRGTRITVLRPPW